MSMKEMCMTIALWAGLCLSLPAQEQEDKTAGGVVKVVPDKKTEVDAANSDRTVTGSSANSKGTSQVQRVVAPAPDDQDRGIQRQPDEEDASPDTGIFVAMADRGWDVINPADPNKTDYSEIIQSKGVAPTFSNNMMDSPDGSQRSNDGWKLFGWTY